MSDRLRQVFEKRSYLTIQAETESGLERLKVITFDQFEAAVKELNAPYEELIQSYHDYVLLIGEEDLSEGTFKLIWEGKDYSND